MLDTRLHKRMSSGHDYNEVVGEYLKGQGIPCEVPDLRFAQTEAEIAEFSAEEKDVILWDRSVIEVKSQSRIFGVDPRRYPWETFIVDTIGYRLKRVKPIAYVFVSKPTGAMLTLNTATEGTWWEERITDGRDGIPSVSLISAKENLRSMAALVAYLRSRMPSVDQPF